MATQLLVCFTLVMLTVTMVVPLTGSNKLQPEHKENNQNELDEQLRRVIRSLDKANGRREEVQQRQRKQTEDIVFHQMSAVTQNNSLPNYFLYKQEVDSTSEYRQGALVFLHHPQAAGSAIVSCLDDIAHEKSLAASPIMDSDARLLWATEDDGNREVDKAKQANRDRFDLHRGQYAFGICNDLNRKCSHFTMLREPMSRAVSSYRYCQTAYGDEMCRVVNANKLTLREWIIHQGSVLFRQLLFQPHWCHSVEDAGSNVTNMSDHAASGHEAHRKSMADPDHVPCWHKHRQVLDANVTPETQHHLLEYIVNNLGRWFAVIGLYDELGASLAMFEHVYGLPFTQCANFKKTNIALNNAEIFDNRSNRKKRRHNEDDLDNDPEYIKYDYAVQKALEVDVRIYKEAKKLFRIQRQVLFNKIAR